MPNSARQAEKEAAFQTESSRGKHNYSSSVGPVWMQLLTLHNPAEKKVRLLVETEVILTSLEEPLLLQTQDTTTELGSRSTGELLSDSCVSMNHHKYIHRHPAAPAHLPAVPLPAQGASLLPAELRTWARLCLTALGPLPALIQTLSQEEKA